MKKILAIVLSVTQFMSVPAYGQSSFSSVLERINSIESPKLNDTGYAKPGILQVAKPKPMPKPKALKTIAPVLQTTETPILAEPSIVSPVHGNSGMVSSASSIATNIGVEVLNRGGNAVDAAISMAFTMAVVLPRAGNIGGGGFMLVHDAKTKETRAIDYRETAPKNITEDAFLDENGNVNKNLIRHSYLSSGVPGTVKGLDLAYRLYASKDWDELLQPAIQLAENGFSVDRALSTSLKKKYEHLSRSPEALSTLFKAGSYAYERGDVLYQKNLAKTLKSIAYKGAASFYEGEIADKIVKAMQRNGGLITKADLADYKARLRDPVEGIYKGYKVISMPPPSSGGVHLIQILKILSGFPLNEWGFGSSKTLHVIAEAMRYAYADRSKYLGDPDFVKVPVRSLTSDLYSNRLRKGISMGSATPSELIEIGKFLPNESPQTTHFTVVDKWGNVVTNTYTLNFSYGSGHMVEGTGILLNNEMDDFAAKVGAKNAYGLVGGQANKIEPEKRPLSSMTPTLVFDKNDEFFLSVGSPGGSRIITTVLQVILNVIDHKMNLAEAVLATRMHHQWQPDYIRVEKGFSPDTLDILRSKGHAIKEKAPMGAVMAILKNENGYTGVADTRRAGALAAASGTKPVNENSKEFEELLSDFLDEYEEKHETQITPVVHNPTAQTLKETVEQEVIEQEEKSKKKPAGISLQFKPMITPVTAE